MLNQKKVTDRRIFKPIRMLSILFLAVLIPLTGYTADLDSDLINAVLQADTATVSALLATGSDVNAKNRDGETVLILAAKYGYTDVVKALLAKGAEVNAKSREGQTALLLAANNGHADVVKTLLAKGAEVNAKDPYLYGRTALTLAVIQGHTDTVKVLLAEGADLNAKDRFGDTALTCSKRCGHVKITRLLKEAGARE